MTSKPTPVVVKAAPADRDRCIGTLGAAFTADPLIRWMFPEPHQYLTYFVQVGQFFAGRASTITPPTALRTFKPPPCGCHPASAPMRRRWAS